MGMVQSKYGAEKTQENGEPVDRMGYLILGQIHIWLK